MEEFSSYYSELNLLQLKYEHLVEIARMLLRPWPDTSITEEERSKHGSASKAKVETEKESPKPAPHSEELEQLDTLLSKAQKLRIQTKPEEKATKRSIKAASSIYNAGIYGEKSTNKVKNGPNARRSGTEHSRHRHGHTDSKFRPKQAGSFESSKLQPGVKEERQVHSNGASKEKKVSEQLQKETQGFSLIKKGTQLSLPSKYSRLKNLIARCEEALAEDDSLIASRAAATHFSKRLLLKSGTASDHIRLQLAAEKLHLLKQKLMCISPQEWTVSERTNWQDVFLVKTKVDLLIRSYDTVLLELSLKTTPTHHGRALLEPDRTGSFPCQHAFQEFGYSSLQDWNALTQLQLQSRFREWEEKFLGEIQRVVLPLAARAITSCSANNKPGHQDPPHAAISTLQAIHTVTGLMGYPAYFNTETLTQR